MKIREYNRQTKTAKNFYKYVTKMLSKYDEVPYFEDFEDWEKENFEFSMSDKYFTVIFEYYDGVGYYFTREN